MIDSLNDIYNIKKLEGENREEFTARMKVRFDGELGRGEYELVDTGIEIPDIPVMAPPSTTNAMNLLVHFNDQLAYQMTWDQWLTELLIDCCNDVSDDYIQIMEEY